MLSFALFIVALLLLVIINADRPVDWFEINCPSSVADQSCTYTNPNEVDIAVSLFFQTEDNSGSSFQCVANNKLELSKASISKPMKPFTCPSPMVYSYKNYWSYCLLEDLTFPSDLSKVQSYCEYLKQGYEGFTFQESDFPNYKCPPSMRQGNNNEGTIFCTYDLPSDTITNLPNDTQSVCTPQAFEAGELGFRFDNNGSTPTPTIVTDAVVYCSRDWNMQQQGSAGDCYFILPAKESFSCHGKGTTNIIGAHAVKLGGTFFESGSTKITSLSNYTNNNRNKDEWIYLEMESAGKNSNSLQCNYRTAKNAQINLCNFTASDAAGSIYSCNFNLPAGKQMKCVTSGNVLISSAYSRTMTISMLADAEPIRNESILCPNVTFPLSTMCDCYFENPSTTDDMLIIVESANINNQFDSYHCYIWGVNVCAWGANDNNLNDAGGCYFILPAGAMYNCSMQWGSTSIIASTALQLNGTMYVKNEMNSIAYNMNIPGTKLPESRSLKDMTALWNKWKVRHNKQYDSNQQEAERFSNFRHFVSLADNNINLKVDEIKNEMADLSMKEFEDLYRGCSLPADLYDKEKKMWKIPDTIDLNAIPTSVDWRTKGAITPIKNQGQCGSCWSFSTTGVLESAWQILTGDLVSLSEQELVSCEKDCYGCDGGWPYKAIQWVANNGIDTEASYNYTSGGGNNGICDKQDGIEAPITGHVTGYQFVESTEDAMAAYVASYGPISISLDAMTQLWWPYSDTSGVMQGCCNKDPDHAVLIVGYGVSTTNSLPYWIIKNSWGTDWGYDGYLYLERGTDQCGITVQPVVPTLKK